ncbi:flagellar biosynthetic protein FliR [Sideroxydans lithotrophicus]|uniref:Flagellar biosynthetic protein FliR n=1 Tax=Sideroxydans lithotrophicus (strain ES-1) TaxID=580332 RepID=D5CMZ0_SIDLE|nr:flagellar biosynthetic protein FliR [Sideroxydans lithotrophicus]ADE10826.1 flagellar biosynthetic protein FliR [Sideroxydans lithotrophicus ES-1]
MISFTSAQLSAWLAAFIFPLARILALIASSPLYGIKEVPARIKVGFAIAITIIIAPTLDIPANLDPASAQGLFVLVQQIVAGVIIGFSIRLIFVAVEMAGDLTGMQMGLGFASFYDPVNATFTPIVAQFLGILASLAFLAANGHLYLLVALADSFRDFPIGATVPSAHAFRTMAEWGGSLFSHALQFSLPLIGALLITNIALGILARSAPQLNIFAVGFPITIAVGFVTLWLTLPYLAPVMDYFTHEGVNSISRIMLQLGGH